MRSIKKAAGEGDATNYKEVTYEGYAPCGVAVIVEVVTDNLNRTASEVRHIFDKCGGSLGATGCVSWKFERKGVIVVDNSKGMDEDEMMMLALDAGAADVEMDGDTAVVYTDPSDFSAVRDNLEAAGCTFLSAERAMVPTTTTELPDEESVQKVTQPAGLAGGLRRHPERLSRRRDSRGRGRGRLSNAMKTGLCASARGASFFVKIGLLLLNFQTHKMTTHTFNTRRRPEDIDNIREWWFNKKRFGV